MDHDAFVKNPCSIHLSFQVVPFRIVVRFSKISTQPDPSPVSPRKYPPTTGQVYLVLERGTDCYCALLSAAAPGQSAATPRGGCCTILAEQKHVAVLMAASAAGRHLLLDCCWTVAPVNVCRGLGVSSYRQTSTRKASTSCEVGKVAMFRID